MASARSVATELRARLRERHAALTHMGHVDHTMRLTPAWWRPTKSFCWWFYGSSVAAADEDARAQFREGTEALVLLGTLARVDLKACIREIRDAWPSEASAFRNKRYRTMPPLVIGFAYHVRTPNEMAAIAELIASEEPPNRSFLDDYVWMKTALAMLGDRGLSKLPTTAIPVRLIIHLGDDRTNDLASVLRQVLRIVEASSRKLSIQDDDQQAAAVARFQVVAVDLGVTPANTESLTCLAQLKQLGVRVQLLPSLDVDDASAPSTLAVTSALQTLLPPQSMTTRPIHTTRTKEVYVTDTTTSHFLPSIFSAIHASKEVQTVRVEVQTDPTDVNEPGAVFLEDYPEPGTARTLWRWAAYTLFSRDANPHVKNVTVYMDYVDQMLEEIGQVLRADNPLAELFETTGERDNQWLSATQFHIQEPSAVDQRASETSTSTTFTSPVPLCVRVVDSKERNGTKWWRVLLPGRGPAWVKDDDAETPVVKNDALTAGGNAELEIKFEGIYAHNIPDAMALLRLLPRTVQGIELESGVYADEEGAIDMNDWTVELLRSVPSLERLKFPCLTELTRLSIFAEAAEEGHACLRSLSLFNTFYPDEPELLPFLRVLSDNQHPLTTRLEELELVIYAPEETAETVLNPVWRRMLEQNRTLHTISVTLTAPTCIDTDNPQVAIRTGPLPTPSKLAFLSVLDARLGHAQLDASVISTVFAFAAQHRVRTFKIMWDREL